MPRKQAAKVKKLQQCLGVVRTAINAKRWAQARYGLSQARALVNALPADQALQERDQLSLLRKKFAARDTPAAKQAVQKKAAVRSAANKSAQKKPALKATPKKATPQPAPDLGRRFLNRASLGYGPAEES
ncbi:hypothetical protein [Streptomyces sp. NPDC056361]|uniref:hypothetical protein n=1 Tax=Streptomyces sp. NPDC056361 TaxID=3345795 RepID=UPI0035D6DB98